MSAQVWVRSRVATPGRSSRERHEMAIELARLRGRKQVAWLRDAPPEEARRALEEREYLVTQCTDDELQDPAYLSGLSAVIFTQSDAKPLHITRDLENHARQLLDYDCRIILRSTTTGARSLLINSTNSSSL